MSNLLLALYTEARIKFVGHSDVRIRVEMVNARHARVHAASERTGVAVSSGVASSFMAWNPRKEAACIASELYGKYLHSFAAWSSRTHEFHFAEWTPRETGSVSFDPSTHTLHED